MKIRATMAGDKVEVKVLMSHEMETGQRKDSKGANIPAHFIQNVTATHNGKVVLSAQWGQALGAHNATRGRRQGLAGKSAWKRMEAEYEKLRQDGRLPASYEVIYGHAWAPNQLPDGRQVVQMPSPRQRRG